MAAVGIIPSNVGPDKEPIGFRFRMAGQQFVVTGYVTQAEWFQAMADYGFAPEEYNNCPAPYYQRISTD